MFFKPGEEESNTLKPYDESTIKIEDFYCDIEVVAKDKPDKNLLSKKFVNLIGQGYKPGEAAKLVGTSIKGIMSDSKVRKQIEGLLKDYKLQADVRRDLVRATTNKIVLENMDGDPTQQKLALDAAKVIAADTEVGINAPPQPGIQINVGNLTSVFAALDDENKGDNVIDVVGRAEYPSDGGGMASITEANTEVLDEEGIRRLAEESVQ